jgi:hypothetical protein
MPQGLTALKKCKVHAKAINIACVSIIKFSHYQIIKLLLLLTPALSVAMAVPSFSRTASAVSFLLA